MMVRYWQPFEEIETLRRQFDRTVDEMAPAPLKTTFTPAASLSEDNHAYQLRLLLPGVDVNDVDIQASRKMVSISGERRAPELAEGVQVLHNDISYGTFRRVVNLPAGIEHENIDASYADGLLTLRLPKSVENLNRVVKVTINGETPSTIESGRDTETT